MKTNSTLHALAVFLFLATVSLRPSFGAQKTWTGSISTDYGTAGNWNPSGVPASTDTVTIVTGSRNVYLDANRTVSKFTITSGTMDLQTYTLTITATAAFTSGTINNGTVTVNSSWTTTFSGTVFSSIVSVESAHISLNGSVFHNSLRVVKGTSSGASTGTGGNTFYADVEIINTTPHNLVLGNTSSKPDSFLSALNVTTTGTGGVLLGNNAVNNLFNGTVTLSAAAGSSIYLCQYGTATFNDDIILDSVSGSIRFGISTGSCIQSSGHRVVIGPGGFSAGTVYFRNFIQNGTTDTLNLNPTGTAKVFFEAGSVFSSPVIANANVVGLNGSRFLSSSHFTITSTAQSQSAGGNYFGGPTTIINNGVGSSMILQSSSPDTFASDVLMHNITDRIFIRKAVFLANATLKNSRSCPCYPFYVGYYADQNFCTVKGNLTLEDSAGALMSFGQGAGSVILFDSGSSLSIAPGFAGSLLMGHIVQQGPDTIAFNMGNNPAAKLNLDSGSVFNGPFVFNGSQFTSCGNTYNNTVSITRNNSSNGDIHKGGNVFNAVTVFTDSSFNGHGISLANLYPDTFNAAVTFIEKGSTTTFIRPAYAKNTVFKGNVTVEGTAAVPFGANGGKVTFSGSNDQSINKTGSFGPTFKKVEINKPAGTLKLNAPLTLLADTFFLTKGVVLTDVTNILSVADNGVMVGGSDSSYVHGPVKKTGNDAFCYMLGDSSLSTGGYHPLTISNPSTTSVSFTAQYVSADHGHGTTADNTMENVAACEYWSLIKAGGSAADSVHVTLGWNENNCNVLNVADMKVARWDTTKWKDRGNGATTGDTSVGSVRTLYKQTAFGDFTLGDEVCTSLSASANSNSPVCQSTDIELTSSVSGGTSPYSYLWIGPNFYSSENTNPVRSSSDLNSAGYYHLFVHGHDECPTIEDSVYVEIHETPFAGLFIPLTGDPFYSFDSTICSGNNIILNVFGFGSGTINGTLTDGTTFSGDPYPSFIPITVTPTSTTDYFIATMSDEYCEASEDGLLGEALVKVHSIAFTWNGTSDNDWYNGSNWTPNGVPYICGDTAIIESSANMPELTANTTIGVLIMNDGTLTLNAPLFITQSLVLNKGIIFSDTTNILTLSDNATASGGSDSSYICGPMMKIGDDVFTFPLGDTALHSGAYHPFGISTPGSSSDAFTVQYFATGQTFGNALDDSIENLSDHEYWNLERVNGTSEVHITLGWNRNSRNTFNLGDIRIAGWDDSLWSDKGNNVTSGSNLQGTILSSEVIDQGSFTLANYLCSSLRVNAGGDPVIFNNDTIRIGGYPTARFGTSPYNYVWNSSFGLSDSTIANPRTWLFDSVSYVLTVTDSRNCEVRDTVNIQPTPDFKPGKLFIGVNYLDAIPTLIDSGDSIIVELADSVLRTIYQSFNVTAFERAFEIIDSFPAEIKHGLDKVYEISCNCDENALLEAIGENNNGNYEYAEKIMNYKSLGTPDDFNWGGYTDYAKLMMLVDGAWDITQGNENISIGVFDDEAQLGHDDFVNKDGSNQIIETIAPTTSDFHGTSVLGCIAAATNNNLDATGVAWKCKLRYGNRFRSSWQKGYLTFALHGARVFNYSFTSNCSESTTDNKVIQVLHDYGCVQVSGAGNGTFGTSCPGGPQPGNNGYLYPGANPHMIRVTGINEDYNHYYYDIGTSDYVSHTHNDRVDICAPAYHVLGLSDGNGYGPFATGTSFASPLVAGVCALMLSVNPCLTPDQVKYIIKTTAQDVYSNQTNTPVDVDLTGLLGAGIIDAAGAVQAAISGNYTPLVEGPEDLCFGSNQTFSIELPPYSGSSVSWSVTGGATLPPSPLVSSGKSNVAVDWGSGSGGTVSATITSLGIQCPVANLTIAPCTNTVIPQDIIIGDNNTCNGNLISYLITPLSGSSVTWSVTGGTIISSCSSSCSCGPTCSITILWDIAGGTVYAAISGGPIVQLDVAACCSAGLNIPKYINETFDYYNMYLINTSNEVKSLNGTTILDGNIYMNGDFLMGPNAKIELTPGSVVHMINCKFYACDNFMWDGIYASGSNSKIEFGNNNIIEDAQNAFVLDNGAIVSFPLGKNNKLNKNYKGIVINNYNGNWNEGAPNYYSWIKDLIIDCADNSNAPTTLLAPHQGGASMIGIEVNNVSNFKVGGYPSYPVFFKNLQNGIYFNDASAILENCQFNNCINGIYFNDASTTIENCQFNNCIKGIFYEKCNNKQVSILRNGIYGSDVGIHSLSNPFTESIILSNEIVTGDQYWFGSRTGILIDDIKGLSGLSFINNNTIEVKGLCGIVFSNSEKNFVSSNLISMNQAGGNGVINTYGVLALNTDGQNYNCNFVSRQSTYNKQYAIGGYYAGSSDVGCNIAVNTNVGLNFIGDCSFSQLYGSYLSSQDDGIVIGDNNLSGASVIGHQRLPDGISTPGNKYLGTDGLGAFNHAATYSINSDAGFYDFWVNTGKYLPSTNLSSGLGTPFNPANRPETPFECPMDCPSRPAFIINKNHAEQVALHAADIASGDSIVQWSMEKRLYQRLRNDTALLNSSAILQNYADSLAATNTGRFAEVAHGIASVYDFPGDEGPDSATIGDRITAATSINDDITPVEIFEENQKSVNTILLNTVAVMRFDIDSSDAEILLSIAEQCPRKGGPAVFEARSLYALFDHHAFFYDDSLCGNEADTCELPGVPSEISGHTTTVCNSTQEYSIEENENADSYKWSITGTGATISGDSTNASVEIDFSDTVSSVVLTASAINSCGISSRSVILYGPPHLPDSLSNITDSIEACAGDTMFFEFPKISGSLIQASAYTIVEGDTAGVQLVLADTAVHIFKTGTAIDLDADNSTSLNFWIAWNEAAEDVLHVTVSNECGEENKTFYVSVTECVAERKIQPHYSGTEIKSPAEAYPNPTTGMLNIKFNSELADVRYSFNVTDITGRVMLLEDMMAAKGINRKQIDLTRLGNGIYFINLVSYQKTERLTVVVE